MHGHFELMFLHRVCIWCTHRTEEGVEYPGTRAIDIHELRSNLGSPVEQSVSHLSSHKM